MGFFVSGSGTCMGAMLAFVLGGLIMGISGRFN
jgi:hypothetical protein